MYSGMKIDSHPTYVHSREEDRPRGPSPRVLIVAEHASAKFGGEAILPLQYFRFLRRRGVEAWLIAHARTKDELEELFPDEQSRIRYIPDTLLHRILDKLGKPLPARIEYFSTGLMLRILSQWMALGVARDLVREQNIDVVHQPIPVSPKEPSMLRALGAPLVIGPMNGGMSYPPAFRVQQRIAERAFLAIGRRLAPLAHSMIPGKMRAQTLLISNQRTRDALPRGVQGDVIEVVDNGVDLSLWRPRETAGEAPGPPRFAFVGRLISLKAVDLLIEAFGHLVRRQDARLELIGDGPVRPQLESRVAALGLGERITFHGTLTQVAIAERLRSFDIFVLPSLHECGGAVILEAMAVGLPIIATRWGGPIDYVTPECGILIDPTGREGMISGLTEAMERLASSPALARKLGAAGRERAVRHFDWERKIDTILEIYRRTMDRAQVSNAQRCCY
jgi:glycosyltransferase involved in cell wall biosynthesis